MKSSKKVNSFKKNDGVPLLNFKTGIGFQLLNFEGGPRSWGPAPTCTPCPYNFASKTRKSIAFPNYIHFRNL